ncbi:MAG: hypothetical protein ACRDNO_01850 [Trebonia sp.]
MNITYLIYEAERPRSMAEQRETDARAGEFAAAVARLGRTLRHPATGKQSARRHSHRPVGATVTCAIPRSR